MRYLLLIFIVVPVLEMWLLIKVGGVIGALPTIAIVLLTAMVGVALLRVQGFRTLFKAQEKMSRGELPAQEMAEGICLAIGGALLLTPGFVTDAIGFCCLIPGVRQLIVGLGMRSFTANVRTQAGFTGHHGGSSRMNEAGSDSSSNTIDGDYKRED